MFRVISDGWALFLVDNWPYRKRVVLPPSGRLETYVSVSIHLESNFTCLTGIGLFLVDPPVTSVIRSLGEDQTSKYEARASHGIFEDFRAPESFSAFNKSPSGDTWNKTSMMKNIIHYLQACPPPGLDMSHLTPPSIPSIGYYPIYITLSERNIYNHLTSRCSKHYEYSDQLKASHLHDKVLVDLQRWKRRSKSGHRKLNILRDVISSHILPSDDPLVWNGALQDINYLREQLRDYTQSFEQMVVVATSLVQLLDSRRSMLEAINTKRLTFLVLVFVPLAWVLSLFSMSDVYFPDHDLFWVHFATALPALAVVLLLSALPYSKLAIAVELYKSRVRNQGMRVLEDLV
jgi:hypothetical protein